MLLVTIELMPGGYQPARRTIACMRLANMSELAKRSDYSIKLLETANPLAGTPARIAFCEILDHDRMQSVWVLIEKAAAEARRAQFVEL